MATSAFLGRTFHHANQPVKLALLQSLGTAAAIGQHLDAVRRQFAAAAVGLGPGEEFAQGGQAAIDRRRRAMLDADQMRFVVTHVGRRYGSSGKGLALALREPAGKAGEVGLVVGNRLGRRLLAVELKEEGSQVIGHGLRHSHRYKR